MCVVSAVHDYFRQNTAPQQWTWPRFYEYQRVIKEVEKLDDMFNQPDCIDPAKEQFMKDILDRLKKQDERIAELEQSIEDERVAVEEKQLVREARAIKQRDAEERSRFLKDQLNIGAGSSAADLSRKNRLKAAIRAHDPRVSVTITNRKGKLYVTIVGGWMKNFRDVIRNVYPQAINTSASPSKVTFRLNP